ncbi:MAG TPA: hypothetical protein VLX28_04200 [Thermoanaerobaculia bacterium]|nr:hypothetical protein [Thermoanaerobaculia bacterium]
MATADATDVSTRDARPGAALPWGARLLVTLVLLALYYFGHRLKLPFVNPGSTPSLEVISRFNLLNLGYTALFAGFILVELFSVATPTGRRLRQAGAGGRARLNRAALSTSLVIVALQSLGIAYFLERTPNPTGEPYVDNPGLGFVLILMATVTASTAAVFVLANLLSDFGIGNGFALLNLVELGPALIGAFGAAVRSEGANSPELAVWLLGLSVLSALLIRFVRRAEATHTPAFPQGILAVAWAGSALPFGISLLVVLPWNKEVLFCVAVAVVVGLFSWICFHLFSSRPRLEANVPEPAEELGRLAGLLRRRLPLATAFLAGGALAFMAWQRARPLSYLARSGLLCVVVVIAIGFDLVEQYRFMQRNRLTTRLVQLDNVHFSYRLVELLTEEGIDALARGHVLRSLYFFLGPLYKIDVLVPVEDLEDARGVLAELEAAREVKVF